MANERRTLAAAGPVAAGAVARLLRHGAVERAARQDVVTVRCVAAAAHRLSLLRERVLLRQLVLVAVKIRDAGRHNHALDVRPGSGADAVARIHRGLTAGGGGTQIGVPRARTRAGCGGKLLAMRVGPRQPAEVRALSRACARDEEASLWRLRLCEMSGERRRHPDRDPNRQCSSHLLAPLLRGLAWIRYFLLIAPAIAPRTTYQRIP